MVLRLIRCIDGIIYALIATVLLLLHPSLGRNEIGHLDLILVLPLALIAFCASRIPLHVDQTPSPDERIGPFSWRPIWGKVVLRLRFFSIVLVAISPLAILWSTVPANSYLAHNAFWLGVAVLGLSFNLLALANLLALRSGERDLAIEIRTMALVTFFGIATSYISACTVLRKLGWTAGEFLDYAIYRGFTAVLELAFGVFVIYVAIILLRVQQALLRFTQARLPE